MASQRQLKLLAAGVPAPDFRLARLDGGETSLAEIAVRGPALLVFFKISCPVCQMTLPFLGRIHATGSLPVYGISQNDARDTREFMQEFDVTRERIRQIEAKALRQLRAPERARRLRALMAAR